MMQSPPHAGNCVLYLYQEQCWREFKHKRRKRAALLREKFEVWFWEKIKGCGCLCEG